MPKADQKAKSGAKANAAPASTFILSDDELETLASNRGRKPQPSVYLDDVRKAAETGDVMGVRLTDTVTSSWVQAQLRKAAKQLGIDSKRFTVYNREDSKTADRPHGFIAYRVTVDGSDN